MHVMLVQDDHLLRETVADHLSDAGYDVLATSTAEDALTVMAFDGFPAVVATDVDLGRGMSGLELAAKLRSFEPEVAVTIVTGRPDSLQERPQHARERHFGKPVALAEIAETVSVMISKYFPAALSRPSLQVSRQRPRHGTGQRARR